jgi:predicted ribosome quality control (RQC) complex YloA/Tae2 family protein
MPYDGTTAAAVCRELNTRLAQSKVHKIYQPVKNEVLLYFSDKDKTAITLSADAAFPRVHATKRTYANAQYPPPFCMLLRKYLIGSVLKSVSQVNADRIIRFEFEGLTGAGVLTRTDLIAEVMGKHSNVILVDSATGMILDAVKHIGSMQSSVREVLPRKTYALPPNDKLDPAQTYAQEAVSAMRFHAQKTLKAALVATFSGVSNQLALSFIMQENLDEGACAADFDEETLKKLLNGFINYVRGMQTAEGAHIYSDESGRAVDFSAGTYDCYRAYTHRFYASVNEAADVFYEGRASATSSKTITNTLSANLSRSWRASATSSRSGKKNFPRRRTPISITFTATCSFRICIRSKKAHRARK